MFRLLFVACVLTTLQLTVPADDAKEMAAAITPYLDDDTIAVVRCDLAKLDSSVVFDPVFAVFKTDTLALTEIKAAQTQLDNMVSMARTAGAKQVFVVFSMVDLPTPGPFILATMKDDAAGEALLALFKQFQNLPPFDSCVRRGGIVYLGTAATLNRLVRSPTNRKTDLATAFETGKSAMAQLVIIPSDDHRRVIREMVPRLTGTLNGLSGEDLADGIQWASVAVDKRSIRLTIQSSDGRAAEQVGRFVAGALRLVAAEPKVKEFVPSFDQLLTVLKPKVNASRVEFELNDENRGLDSLIAALTPGIKNARASARRQQQMNTMKQFGLAMHNYHDTYKSFPTQANYDKDGKPLLSWRVHVLPYLEELELYQQFHLDEPWDSPHNLKLAEQMPAIYESPGVDPKTGKTTILVPYGKDMVFEGQKGIQFKDIIDGASSTIMVVQAGPKSAVPWTKPADLNVDLKNPVSGFGEDEDGVFLVTFCDGSVHALSLTIDPEMLRRLFQRNDGKPIEN